MDGRLALVAGSGKWAFVETSSLPGTSALGGPHGLEAAVACSGLCGKQARLASLKLFDRQ